MEEYAELKRGLDRLFIGAVNGRGSLVSEVSRARDAANAQAVRADRAEQLCLRLANIIESHGYRIPSGYLDALADIRTIQASESANRADGQ